MTASASEASPASRWLVLRDLDAAGLRTLATREARLAFWINTYNTLVAEGIVALGLHRTVWDVPAFFDRICYRIGHHIVSANEIEHGILRGNRPHPLATQTPFGADDPRRAWSIAPLDPRTHCAISCGARSCPPVRVYDARRVQTQLAAAADAFVSREVTLESGRLAVTELFRWFAGDFAAHPGGLAGFLLRHLTEGPVRRVLQAEGLADVTWRPYDWRLASPPAQPDPQV
jgi:hypothetical protein